MKSYDIRNGSRIIGKLYTFTDYNPSVENRMVVNNIIKNVPFLSDVGYAGFKAKSEMGKHVSWTILGRDGKVRKAPKFSPAAEKASIRIIEDIVNKCARAAPPGKDVRVFLFPTFDSFVKKIMSGATGLCIGKNTLMLYVHPNSKSWKKALAHSTCHEYAHAITHSCRSWKTLLDGIVFEGIAEHFCQSVLRIGPSAWSKSLKEKRSRALLKKLEPKLNSNDGNLYREVFFGSKAYPSLTGYSLGYYIVSNYLRRTKKRNWKGIFKEDPKKILEKSGMLS